MEHKPPILNKTIKQARSCGMSLAAVSETETCCCPECGCQWYGNQNACGEGHRTCFDCNQEWWTDIKYDNMPTARVLPER